MNDSETVASYPVHLASVFRLLRSGRHLCVEDKVEYRDLQVHFEQYESVFAALGYKLNRHHQNFFYFSGGNTLVTKGLQSITLFMLILFQHLEDNKFADPDRAWEQTLTNRLFTIDELPHFDTAQRRGLMFSLDVSKDNLREKVLRTMTRLGIIHLVGTKQFQFRAPVYRFVELCLDYATAKNLSKPSVSELEEADSTETTYQNESPQFTAIPNDDEQWEDVEDYDE